MVLCSSSNRMGAHPPPSSSSAWSFISSSILVFQLQPAHSGSFRLLAAPSSSFRLLPAQFFMDVSALRASTHCSHLFSSLFFYLISFCHFHSSFRFLVTLMAHMSTQYQFFQAWEKPTKAGKIQLQFLLVEQGPAKGGSLNTESNKQHVSPCSPEAQTAFIVFSSDLMGAGLYRPYLGTSG